MRDKNDCLSALPSSKQQRKHHSGKSVLHCDCSLKSVQHTQKLSCLTALQVVKSLCIAASEFVTKVHYYHSLSASLFPVDAPLNSSSISHTGSTSYTISLDFSV